MVTIITISPLIGQFSPNSALSLVVIIQKSIYFLSQSKKCHKMLQMSNEFVWHLLLTMMKPWMTIQSLFNDTLVYSNFIELCFELDWSQCIEPGSDWPASMTDIESDSCNADYCTEPCLNKHWLYIGAQNQSWVVNWSMLTYLAILTRVGMFIKGVKVVQMNHKCVERFPEDCFVLFWQSFPLKLIWAADLLEARVLCPEMLFIRSGSKMQKIQNWGE